jgi:hypothetical protein
MHAKPSSELTLSKLVARGYLALRRGTIRENLTDAMTSFDKALRRDPHYQPALLAVARVHIIAAMNFIDLDFSPDLGTRHVRRQGQSRRGVRIKRDINQALGSGNYATCL